MSLDDCLFLKQKVTNIIFMNRKTERRSLMCSNISYLITFLKMFHSLLRVVVDSIDNLPEEKNIYPLFDSYAVFRVIVNVYCIECFPTIRKQTANVILVIFALRTFSPTIDSASIVLLSILNPIW